jgi:hypothetical protein
MKPEPSDTHDTLPQFQICKGTRSIRKKDAAGNLVWQDYRPRGGEDIEADALESLYVNALREGIEEIGLIPENITKVVEWGRVQFQSETRKTPVGLWLYLAEVRNPEHFAAPSIHDAKTAECRWLTLPQDAHLIRPDHLIILQEVQRYFT